MQPSEKFESFFEVKRNRTVCGHEFKTKCWKRPKKSNFISVISGVVSVKTQCRSMLYCLCRGIRTGVVLKFFFMEVVRINVIGKGNVLTTTIEVGIKALFVCLRTR